MNLAQFGRGEVGSGVALVVVNLVVDAQFLEQPEHPLRARVLEMMQYDHDDVLESVTPGMVA